MTNEDTVLCLCAQSKLNSNEVEYLEEIITTKLDWQVIYRSAAQNGLLPFLHNTLKKYPDIIPDTIITALKKYSFNNCARNLLQTAALVKIVTQFQTENIFAIPFKGPLLSILLYDDIGLRSFGDLDILISCDDILRAHEVLLTLNYLPELQLTPRKLLRYANHEDNLSFVNSDNQVVVELHWDLAGAYLASPLPIQNLVTTPNQFNVSDCSMHGIANEYLLVYLCVHGAKHKWERLEWISSLAALLKKNRNLDWSTIFSFATEIQCRRMLFLGLLLARNLFTSNIPNSILESIHSDKRMAALEDDIMADLFPEEANNSSSPLKNRFSFFHIWVRDNLQDSLRYQARLFFRPTNVDWQRYPLPADLCFLHYLIRPFRLSWEGINRILHKPGQKQSG